jgi:hypothetical protein
MFDISDAREPASQHATALIGAGALRAHNAPPAGTPAALDRPHVFAPLIHLMAEPDRRSDL